MALLIAFAFLAGAGTAVSPCVLPVLPVALSAGATGGRRRPLGVVTGLALSFTFATVALVYVIHALGLPGRPLRTPAIVALIWFGIAAVVPVRPLPLRSVLVGAAPSDTLFQPAIASALPGFLVDPAHRLESGHSVRNELARVRGAHRTATAGGADAAAHGSSLPVLGAAPEIVGTERWFNTPGGRRLTLAGLRAQHRVVLIDFWTYSCINCLRTLPYVKAWDRGYRRDGLTIIGIHTPEFPFERSASNVAAAVSQNGIRYTVAQDNDQATWNAFGNQYWPAKYLIDDLGRVRYAHFGEGDYDITERAIRSLLREAGARALGGLSDVHAQQAAAGTTTPESYLGAERAERFANGTIDVGGHDYGNIRSKPPRDGLAYGGRWRIGPQVAEAGSGARLDLHFHAQRVFLVLGSPGRQRSVRVLLDGRPLPDGVAGRDVHGGVAQIEQQRLYRLVDLHRVGDHALTLLPDAGMDGYAFTFG